MSGRVLEVNSVGGHILPQADERCRCGKSTFVRTDNVALAPLCTFYVDISDTFISVFIHYSRFLRSVIGVVSRTIYLLLIGKDPLVGFKW